METIKDYIESMFKNLPQNERVLKAKKELLQMMEDKYEELKNQGKSENEAIGTVISEFGNLEELAHELGIGEEVMGNKEKSGKDVLSLDSVKEYLKDAEKRSFLKALSFFLIMTGIAAIVSGFDWDNWGLIIFIVMIALSVGVKKYVSYGFSKWENIDNERFRLGSSGKAFVNVWHEEKFQTHITMRTVGNMLCILCILPLFMFKKYPLEDFSLSALFMILALGVGLKKYVKNLEGFYEKFQNAETDGQWYEGVENVQPVNNTVSGKIRIADDIVKTLIKIAILVLIVLGGIKLYRAGKNIAGLNGIHVNLGEGDYEVSVWEDGKTETINLENNFNNINIDSNIMGVYVRPGKETKLKLKYNHKFLKPDVEIDNDTLYISQVCKKNYLAAACCDIELTLPQKDYDDFTVNSQVGSIYVKGLKFCTGDFNANTGSINLNGCNFTDVDLRTNVGSVLVSPKERIDNYDVYTETNVGSIKVGGRDYKKSYETKGFVDGKKIYVETNVGSINIK